MNKMIYTDKKIKVIIAMYRYYPHVLYFAQRDLQEDYFIAKIHQYTVIPFA